MSMQTLTCLQIAWAFSAYTFAVLGLPWLVLHKRFARYPWQERWMGYFLAGNFYLINLVFVLQFLHISNRVTLILGTVLPFAVPYLWKKRRSMKKLLHRAQGKTILLLKGKRKLRTEFQKVHFINFDRIEKNNIGWLRKNGLELICAIILICAIFYEYGLDTIRFYGYKASDVVVHNYWVNLMDENQIFHAGVYPHGFHCIIYYLEQVFGIPTYVLFRVFSLVETLYIHLAVLVPLRGLCKNRYMPYIGVISYVLLPCIEYNTYWRFTATLPQEYGMLFIIPAGFFAIRFFQDFSPQLLMLEKEKAKSGKEKVQFDLVFFVISFSLTITVHFYDTMIAGLFCVGIALAYVKELFNWKYFSRIIGAGILSIALAVLPMAIGVAQGNKLQGSLYWGLNILGGSREDSEETASSKEPEALVETESAEGKENPLTVKEKISKLQDRIHSNSVGSQAPYGRLLASFLMVGSIFLFIIGWIDHYFCQRKREKVTWAIGWFDFLMLLLMEAPLLNLPNIMDGNRSAIFFNYIQVVVWPLISDEVLELLMVVSKKQYNVLNLLPFLVVVGGLSGMIGLQWIRPTCTSNLFEMNQAITCTTNIIHENKRFTWTICSANEERQMILSQGRYEELITFLRELKKVNQNNASIKIPTQYVYFYIEKIPIPYAYNWSLNYDRKLVSEEGAKQDINMESGLNPYKGTNRWVTMSHIYYWALAFQKLHPDAMEVYYEDEDFVCYRLTQNVNSLYELAIDYGYNDP